MNKILVGVVAGVILGFIDGATAWFYPETRPVIGGILMGSTFKGLLAGVLSGWYARKTQPNHGRVTERLVRAQIAIHAARNPAGLRAGTVVCVPGGLYGRESGHSSLPGDPVSRFRHRRHYRVLQI